ncbi:ADP-ribose pyrophosphatase YjhB, NUDIX family [Terribacillus halophilus]|uniref:ADP-ribose pyrophosphatase YjhB, NUDIX family n=1 Tax=Terribacillus halophilus TaxID=361279 RepID=A0A1G6I3F3_9BACI|nr:NUDIX domain-containing protein [Terribacillus halophilus]SDC01014.1 ADP-ribose pyrophosphatase YjhB, NUDIX family [Terribacillus halophilus]
MPPKHIVSAAAIVRNEQDEILLIKGPRRGWEMPGGQVEEGESLTQAAIREVKEESGIEIEVTKFCGIYQNAGESICNTLFLGKPTGGVCTPSEESLEVGYFPLEQVRSMVTWGNYLDRIESCLDENQHPFYVAF